MLRAFCFMQGMISLRVAHPLLARQGQDTGHCSSVTNVVYTEYSKHGGARRYVQLRITFFSFVYTYICMYEIYMYICMYEKKRVTLDHWTIQKRNKDGKFHRGRPKEGRDVLERTDREPSQMAPDIEQSTLYKLLPAKPTVSNYLTHSKTSRKSPTPPDQAFDPISTEQRPNRICIYIYIHDFAHN